MMSPSVSRYLGILGKVVKKFSVPFRDLLIETGFVWTPQCDSALKHFHIHVIFLLVFFYDLAGAMSR